MDGWRALHTKQSHVRNHDVVETPTTLYTAVAGVAAAVASVFVVVASVVAVVGSLETIFAVLSICTSHSSHFNSDWSVPPLFARDFWANNQNDENKTQLPEKLVF